MRPILILAIVCLVSTPGFAQSQTAQKRAEDLARVQELVNDPNPQMRIANFEDIAASGDAVKLQTAVQIALTGNDSLLRSVAFRAYIAGVGRIMAELSVDPALQKALDQAKREDPTKYRSLVSSTTNLEALLSTGMRMDLQIRQFDAQSGRGKLANSVDYAREGEEFNIVGDRLVARVTNFHGTSYPCDFELRPTKDLQIVGSMTCQRGGYGKVAISAPMF